MNIVTQILFGAALFYIIFKLHKMEELLQRLDGATNEIAKDLTALRDQLKDSLTPEQKSRLTAHIERLEALGADPADPIPAE